MISFWK